MSILVEELFQEVVNLSATARVRYLTERGIDPKTQSEVEALVASDSNPTLSIEWGIGRVAHRAFSTAETGDLRCGPFRLGELLGRGGMGAVYLAERVDGEVTQQVAVKLLRPGSDDPQLRQRFLGERQILATLSHPQIARLLDAGHREDGQPYLAMEYVKGKPIDVYAAGLGPRDKIALVLKVSAAVSYLHRNLVVHRDLKPSNILVTDEGEPKLLDFGIAKMLDLTGDTTVTNMRILTPDYASPEQVAGETVTTATDIYSLGAVLYKLLTGASPHQFSGGSKAAIALAISHGEITPPSNLAPGLESDLEMILMKALRKEPQERYATIDQFADDLGNYLESRPIRARKGDAWYRTRKFVRRHWLPVAAATLAVAGLSAGLAVANYERAAAQRRFLDVRQLANKLFDIDTEARKVAGNTKTRQLIVDMSLEYLRRLAADAQADPELALEVGNAYMRVARVQGVPVSQNLGQMDQAEQNLVKAEKFMQTALLSRPTNRTALLRSAQIAHDRMLLARLSDRSDDALMYARKAEGWLTRFDAQTSDKPEASAILLVYLNVAQQFKIAGQFDEALRLCHQGTELARSFNSKVYEGTLLWVSGEVFRRQGYLNEALKRTRESARTLEPGLDNPDEGRTMNFAMALIYQGKILGEENAISLGEPREAASILERAFKLADTFVHQDPYDQSARGRLASAGIALADIVRQSDARRSLEIYDHVLRHMAEIKDNSSFRRFEVSALAGSSYPLRRLDRVGEAQQRLDAAFAILRQLKSYPVEKINPGSEQDVTVSALGDYKADQGAFSEAIEIYNKLLNQVLASKATPDTDLTDAVDVSRLYGTLAALYFRADQTGLGSELEARRLELWRHWDVKLPHNSFVRRQLNLATESAMLR